MKKLIVFILFIAICIPLFAACGEDAPADTTGNEAVDTTENASVTTTPTDEETTETTTEIQKTNYLENVAVNDWDGYVFKSYYSVNDNSQTDFICTNPNGNILNDKIFERNSTVENMYNITIYTDPHTTAYTDVLAAQHSAGWTEGDYNMVTAINRDLLIHSLKGYVANLADYDQISLYNPYWDQAFIDSIMMNDSIYALTGDYSVKANLFVSSICFNKELFQQNGLDEPYALVKNYEWTVDALLGYMDGFALDYGNDGYDKDTDLFSITGWASETSYGTFYGSGFKFCKNDGETISIDYDRKQLDDILDANLDIWTQNGVFMEPLLTGTANHAIPFNIFSSGRSLFCDIVLYKISMFFSEMNDDYGILPEPMFDSEQGAYFSYTGYTIPLLCVPSTDPNQERTGNILEAICAASSDIVIPSMFEIVTKIQHVRDEESADMIDIIIKNKIYDPAHWLKLSGYQNFNRQILTERQNISGSFIQIYSSNAEKELNNYITSYQENLTKN